MKLRLLPLTLVVCPWVYAVAAPVPSLTIGQNFVGSTLNYNNYNGYPPDSNGAIGPHHFVEFINGNFTLYNRTNGTSVRVSDSKFWANAGVSLATSDTLSDPRIVYDPTVQRWFASQVDFDANAAGSGLDPTLEANDFLIAVSSSSDPRSDPGNWHGFLFEADPDNGNFADFPTLGVDANGVYLSGDMFHGETNELGSMLVSIPKNDLLAALPTIANRTRFGILDFSERGQVLQPNNCFDGTVTGKILAPTDIGTDSEEHSNLVCSTVLNAGGPGATLSAATIIPTAPWVVPDNALLGAPAFAPIQPDGSDNLTANEARFSAKVYAVGGVLYAVHNTYLNGRIVIRWYRVRASDNTLLESGTIADPDLDLFFPSIAANAYGVVVIGFNASGASTYIGCYAMAGQTVNGVTTFGSRMLLQAGSVSYHDLNDVLGEILGEPAASRWGDYSATSVDPNDPTHFWTIQMYPSGVDQTLGAGVWSTQITELITAPTLPTLPLLAIQSSGTNLTLSWPTSYADFQLKSTGSLSSSAIWSNVTQTPQTNGTQLVVQLPTLSGQQFFRLQGP